MPVSCKVVDLGQCAQLYFGLRLIELLAWNRVHEESTSVFMNYVKAQFWGQFYATICPILSYNW